eukprot:GHVU01166646.1.p1 GENE.GHVU01166646.1~~GHVU01166646.1.p1  ORF type:complete len:116 (+),score=10.87 GHVU01166646.1:183-530(+)
MSQWQQGTLGCFGNLGLSCLTFCCPCYVFGRNAEALGESCLFCSLCFLIEPAGFGASVALRGRLREKRGIDGSLTEDILCWLLCPYCTLCQEAAEIQTMQGKHMAADEEKAIERN